MTKYLSGCADFQICPSTLNSSFEISFCSTGWSPSPVPFSGVWQTRLISHSAYITVWGDLRWKRMHIFHSFFFTSMDFRDNGHSIKPEARRWKYSVCRWPQRLTSPTFDQFRWFTTCVKNKKCAKIGSKMVKNTVKRAQIAGFWVHSARFVSLSVVGGRSRVGERLWLPKGHKLAFLGLVGG